MSAARSLRDFISERLVAAAEEIFSEFQKTIVQYEDVIDRQRRLLDVTWTPEVKVRNPDLPQLSEAEDGLVDQERNSNLDQEELDLLQVKVEQEELCSSQEEEDLVLKQEAGPVTPRVGAGPVSQLLYGAAPGPAGGEDWREQEPRTCGVDASATSAAQVQADAGCIRCDVCGKSFRDRYYMKNHMRIHTGETPYSCQTCGKSFNQASTLHYHMKIHTGERPYFCKACGKNFVKNTHLTVHMRTHTGEKPFQCSTCGKRFPVLSKLKRHMMTHTGEKPYSCTFCGRSFSRADSLTAHTKIHTGE